MSTADQLEKVHRQLANGALRQAEFQQAKPRLLASVRGPGARVAINRRRLAGSDRWLAGGCGGLARVPGRGSWIWRMVFLIGLLFGGFTLFAYVVLWIFVPREEL